MKFWIKQVLITVAVLIVMMVCGLVAFVLSFDPNSYKNALQVMVQQRTDRQLVIDGDLKVLLFPKIAIQARQVSLSEKASTDTFALVDDLRATIAILPLLTNQLVIEQIDLTGLKAKVVRGRAGGFNFDDLTRWGSVQAPAASPGDSGLTMDDTAIDIAAITVKKSEILIQDVSSEASWKLGDLSLQTGRLKRNASFSVEMSARFQEVGAAAVAKIEAQAVLNVDFESRHFSAKNLTATVKGDLPPGWWSDEPLLKVDSTFKLSLMNLEPENGRIQLERLVLRAKAMREAAPAEFSLDVPLLDISDTDARSSSLAARLRLDGPPSIDLKFALEGLHGSRQALLFDKSILDAAIKRDSRMFKVTLSSPFELKPFARSFALPALEGEVQTLQSAAAKSLRTIPVKAKLFVSLDPQPRVRQPLVLNAEIENLPFATALSSLGIESLMDGQANVVVNLKMATGTLSTVEQSLTGQAQLRLSRASVQGVDLSAGLEALRALASPTLRGEHFQGDATQRTSFDSVDVDLRLAQSIATVTRLNMIAPDWRVTLASPAKINLQNGTIDLVAAMQLLTPQSVTLKRFTVQVRSLLIPLHLTGSIKRPAVNIQWSVLDRDPVGRALRENLLNISP
jgi:uncharacterized lipoprotein YbaY